MHRLRFRAITTLLVLGLFHFGGVAHSQVTNNVLQRVFLLRYKDKAGTAFTIDVDNRQYIITAKHIVPGILDVDTITILHEGSWKQLEVKFIPIESRHTDIAVLAPIQQLSPALPLSPTSDGIFVSQQVYFLGFPYLMRTEIEDFNNGFPIPFVKSGILSAIEPHQIEGYSILYVDGFTNPGFSGGPLVFKDARSGELKVAGVVSGYRINADSVVDKNTTTTLTVLANSGIVVAYDISSAVAAIRKRPEGIKLN